VMHHVAATHDQHPALAQRSQLPAELQVMLEGLLALIDSCTTGIEASGKACTSTDQVPWSMPQVSTSAQTRSGWTTSRTSSASSGSSGAGYSTSNSGFGKP